MATVVHAAEEWALDDDDSEIVDRFMREIHTLKGELRIMGFTGGGRIVHCLEDVLKRPQDGAFVNASSFADLFTEALDEVSGIVTKGVNPDVDEICDRITNWRVSP